jgi:hypothetical protein
MGITNRPIITAPVPGHVGDIFDITVSAIQGPGGAHTGQPFVYPGERFISSKCPKIFFSIYLLHLLLKQLSPAFTFFDTPFFITIRHLLPIYHNGVHISFSLTDG